MSMLIIPAEARPNHIAILGKTGAGKSNAAKVEAELRLDAGERVCVVDPTGTWWGLRLAEGGKKKSRFEPVIFGGKHADVVIGGQHGAAIAETIGTTSTSAIIDTRMMTVRDRTRFFTDFAEGLLRANVGVLNLFIDEAHLFAPQGKVQDPQSGAMLGAATNLVSLGRGLGLRIVLLSQRTAKLHNDALGQVETLVAMRMLLPADRAAVHEWIKMQAGVDGKEVMSSLPGLQTGEAWIWSPGLDLLERRRFPLASTFDSGSASAETTGAALQALDIDEVTKRLEEVAADVLANDPARMKAEIARLKRELEQRPAGASSEELEAEFQRGRAEVEEVGLACFRQGQTLMRIRAGRVVENIAAEIAALEATDEHAPRLHDLPRDVAKPLNRQPAPEKSTAPPVVKQTSPQVSIASSDAVLTPSLQKILDALAYREKLQRREGVATSKPVLGFLIGMSSAGGGFNNYLGKLRTNGHIEYRDGGVALTDLGRRAARAPDFITNAQVQADALAKVQPAQRRIMDLLIPVWPNSLSRADVGEAIGMSPTAGGFNNYLGKLRSMLLLDYSGPGMLRATDYLFPEQA